jgi:hypothetical protein
VKGILRNDRPTAAAQYDEKKRQGDWYHHLPPPWRYKWELILDNRSHLETKD